VKLFGQSTSTRAALLPRFAGIALGLLSVLTGSPWLMLLACACGGVVLVALVLRPRINDLVVTVTMPPRTAVGAEVPCLVEVANRGHRWSSMVHCVHQVSVLDDISFRVDALPPGGSAMLDFTRTALARGVSTSSSAELVTTAPLGLRSRNRTVTPPMRLLVHPEAGARDGAAAAGRERQRRVGGRPVGHRRARHPRVASGRRCDPGALAQQRTTRSSGGARA
jgi:uncharacterized protein (DUF58 family)